MKRVISCVLAVVLVLSLCAESYAVDTPVQEEGAFQDTLQEEGAFTDSLKKTPQEEDVEIVENGGKPENSEILPIVEEDSEDSEDSDETQLQEEITKTDQPMDLKTVSKGSHPGALGQVDVSILSGQILQGAAEFMVALTGEGASLQETVTLNPPEDAKDGGPARGDVTFEDLAAGTYVLTVTAAGFAAFSQEIEVDGRAYALTLMTEKTIAFERGQSDSAHPGFLLIGDVNGDGRIDELDRNMLTDAVEAGEQNPEKKTAGWDGNADLNRSGEVDLADLECLAKGYEVVGDISSTVTEKVPAGAVEVKEGTDTRLVSGDLSALLKNKGSAVLQTAAGGPITEQNAVAVEFDLSRYDGISVAGIVINTGKDDSIESGMIDVTYEEGQTETMTIPFKKGVDFLLNADTVQVTQDGSGALWIDFKTQIAVKKVTLKITGMESGSSLAEITQVEFLNNMADRISEPALDIPQNVSAQAENEAFTIAWDPCVNVTGYEVKISSAGQEETIMTKGETLRISSFGKKDLVNNTTYTAAVRSVNGAWSSRYSESVNVTPKASKKPDPPDGLKLSGAYRSIHASWKKMKNTDSYNLYYREKGSADYQKIEKIGTNSYTLSNLKDLTSYQVYVTGVNELGEGGPSLTGTAETISIEPARMPKYKLINRAKDGEVSEHIAGAYFEKGSMRDSKKDPEGTKTAWGTVDNDPRSHFYLGSWDSGGYNPLGNNGLFYEFDQAYKLQSFALQEVSVQSPDYFYIRVKYWDENGNPVEQKCSISKKMDSDKRAYYLIRLPEAVTTNKIQFGLARYSASGSITCSEVYFYHYDSLEDDIMALYTDDLHTELREDVTQAVIDALRKRINTPDEESGEYHPEREMLERELKTAEDILNSNLSDPVKVHNTITASEVNRGFGGLNAWQPLGVTAAEGEEITVYVGHNTKKTGESAGLQLIATQYHAESGTVSGGAVNLKVGRNDITLPKWSSVDTERGGALYVQYTGSSQSDQYAVRVSGGVPVPCLDLYQVEDEAERLKRTTQYVEELRVYKDSMEALHTEKHAGSKLAAVKYAYDEKNCILGASDILSDTMLLSLPVSQILSASNGDPQAILTSVNAMEKMMRLFYQHKGLSAQAADVADQYPSRHLNIRYQRMFAGAFMYASGNHIGIEWPETRGMVSCASVTADGEGRYVSGNYFGWGIAHEIGHCINQGAYAVAEITNNYYSVLAQAQDTNSSVRFQYENVYKKVTSGASGPASNVFTQLGMYWQLHLAYDNGYNFKTYDQYDQQLQNLFFARVDTYARTPSKAKAPGGITLTLTGDKDQNLMRLSCAAAEKNLLEFFQRWGMTPDQGTTAYAEQFEKETRAIYYVNDDSRVYRLSHGGSRLDAAGTTEAVGDVTAQISSVSASKVDFQLSALIPNEEVLGYEIVRCTRSGGRLEEETAGFTTGNFFQDTLPSLNNRVVTYKVTVIDKYLNRSMPKTLGEIKIQDDGSIDKSGWTVSADGLECTVDVKESTGTPEEPCHPITEDPIKRVADHDPATIYTGIAGDNAQVILQFHKTHVITGFKYQAADGVEQVRDYAVWVCDENGQWIEAARGTFGTDKEQTILFTDKEGRNLAGYRAAAVKLTILNQKGQEIGIAELDVLGATGDDIDFRHADAAGQAAVGRLENAFRYGENPEDVIPEGSLVFTGVYKGNPAYNVVVLYDQDGNIVSGTGPDGSRNAGQIILADVPDTGDIGEVSDGSWVYWIEPQYEIDLQKLKSVRAELYRVDDAFDNTGQRLVSDSLSVEVNAQMFEQPIHLSAAQRQQAE